MKTLPPLLVALPTLAMAQSFPGCIREQSLDVRKKEFLISASPFNRHEIHVDFRSFAPPAPAFTVFYKKGRTSRETTFRPSPSGMEVLDQGRTWDCAAEPVACHGILDFWYNHVSDYFEFRSRLSRTTLVEQLQAFHCTNRGLTWMKEGLPQ